LQEAATHKRSSERKRLERVGRPAIKVKEEDSFLGRAKCVARPEAKQQARLAASYKQQIAACAAEPASDSDEQSVKTKLSGDATPTPTEVNSPSESIDEEAEQVQREYLETLSIAELDELIAKGNRIAAKIEAKQELHENERRLSSTAVGSGTSHDRTEAGGTDATDAATVPPADRGRAPKDRSSRKRSADAEGCTPCKHESSSSNHWN
jgi:hypothetical protein